MRKMGSKLGVFALSLSSCGAVAAQVAGTVMLKSGYNAFYRQIETGNIAGSAGASIDFGKAGAPFGSVTYMLVDNIATEFSVGVPPNFDIYASGSIAAAGKIASVEVLPPTLSLHYRFHEARAALRPSVGIGIARAMFRNARGTPMLTAITRPSGPETTISIDSAWSLAAYIGISYALDDKWFMDGAVVPSLLKTTARLSTGQSVAVKINPVGVNLSVGYRF